MPNRLRHLITMARISVRPSHTACSLEFSPHCTSGSPSKTTFFWASSCSPRLGVGSINHQLICFACVWRQASKDLFEHAHPARLSAKITQGSHARLSRSKGRDKFVAAACCEYFHVMLPRRPLPNGANENCRLTRRTYVPGTPSIWASFSSLFRASGFDATDFVSAAFAFAV